MFTIRYFELLQYTTIVSCVFGANSVIYSKYRNTFYVTKLSHSVLKCTTTWMPCLGVFIILRTVQVYYQKDQLRAFNQCYTISLTWTLCTLGALCLSTRDEDLALMLNRLVRFAQDFKGIGDDIVLNSFCCLIIDKT